ncbi:hypothetical protein SAMN05660742_10762 [Propionispira arboris]|uniref:Uncharacterized protein n=1 Tax=Propionispira arboris TaxID=84035 RepID=A0A1H6YKZ4_9FIRM|nr:MULTISPECIES: hypothetical protein [Propionispira]SEJ41998.1 hypothetical protein SAMN05660742_10762 [Propionispira arboris]
MENIYRVAVHYLNDIGYVEYVINTKAANVFLKTLDKKAAVENYLANEHEIQVPHATLRDFTTEKIQPLASLESFKLAMTRVWGETDVYVDWSRPIDYVLDGMDK